MKSKYELRDSKTPYFFEKDIINGPGFTLKEFEIFDGDKVRWGLKEDYEGKENKYSNTTPLFDNVLDNYQKDKERILYIDGLNCIFQGMINGSEVIGKTNSCNSVSNKFTNIVDFGGEEVHIHKFKNNMVFVSYKEDGLKKCLYFDYKEFKSCSNIFDSVYVDSSFLKSYVIDGTIWPFIGKVNYDNGVVEPMGYDICKNEYITFPLDEKGFIDDNVMIEKLNSEFYNIGYKKNSYIKINKDSIISVLRAFGIEDFDILSKLQEQIIDKVKIK